MKTYAEIIEEVLNIKSGRQNKGTITLGNKVMVSDPCYGINSRHQGVVTDVLEGEYECFITFMDKGDWGVRVSSIEATHKDYANQMLRYVSEARDIAVDSGQAGIFDYEYYSKYHTNANERSHVDSDWYCKVCDLTYQRAPNPYKKDDTVSAFSGDVVDNLGFVSSSGYGDGFYSWKTAKENGKVIAIKIVYLSEVE